jgi:hypothetical protein
MVIILIVIVVVIGGGDRFSWRNRRIIIILLLMFILSISEGVTSLSWTKTTSSISHQRQKNESLCGLARWNAFCPKNNYKLQIKSQLFILRLYYIPLPNEE